ncbi:uncharacterized protein VTP21DRAFT_997 [Calcarisporiella thermophila]|uniref:uncharacterized protein n=1 Tax=Calcarisporiella thermophila TaxID=911321 RepID=UPI0037424710
MRGQDRYNRAWIPPFSRTSSYNHGRPTYQQGKETYSRVRQLITKACQDNGDSNYARRGNAIGQLTSLLYDRDIAPDLRFAIDECFKENQETHDLFLLFEDSKAPPAFKKSLVECIVQIAFIYRDDIDYFVRIIWSHLNLSAESVRNKDKDRNIWLLTVLLEIVNQISKFERNAAVSSSAILKCSSAILSGAETFLDAIESQELLVPTINLIVAISKICPSAFDNEFQEIINLMTGWQIDNSLTLSRQLVIADAFCQFRPLWKSHYSFASDLLNSLLRRIQFSVDFRLYTRNDKKFVAKSHGYIRELSALASCFAGLLKAIIPVLPENLETFEDFRTYSLHSIFHMVNQNPQLYQIFNGAVFQLSVCRVDKIVNLQPKIFNYYASQVEIAENSSDLISGDFLDIFSKIIHEWLPMLHPTIPFCILAMSKSSFIMRLRNISQATATYAINLCRAVIPKHSDRVHQNCVLRYLVQEIVHIIRYKAEENHSATTIQCAREESDKALELVDNEAWEEVNEWFRTPNESFIEIECLESPLSAFTFNMLFLIEAGRTWGAWSTVISISFARILSESINGNLPTSLVGIFLDEWRKLSLSQLQKYTNQNISTEAVDTNSTLESALIYMRGVFRTSNAAPLLIKKVSASWFCELVDILKNSTFIKRKLETYLYDILICLINAAENEPNRELRFSFTNAITKCFDVMNHCKLPTYVFSKIAQRTNDIDEEIAELNFKILCRVNPLLVLNDIGLKESPFMREFKEALFRSSNTGVFRANHFRIVMTHLGMKDFFLQAENENESFRIGDRGNDWLSRQFYSCMTMNELKKAGLSNDDVKQSSNMAQIEVSQNLLNMWGVWESVRYCILSRLKTPFGGPKQTFEALETKLRQLVTELSNLESDIRDKCLRQLRDLLFFIERLEVSIQHAITSSSVSCFPPPSKASTVFFRANRRVCEDWFSRIRGLIIKGAKIIGDDDMTIQCGFQALRDSISSAKNNQSKNFQTWLSDYQETLADTVNALRRVGNSDAIYGLWTWSNNSLQNTQHFSKSHFKWLESSALMTEEHYEDAIRLIHKQLQDETSLKNGSSIRYLQNNLLACYGAIGDLEAYATWERAFESSEISLNNMASVQQDLIESFDQSVLHDASLSAMSYSSPAKTSNSTPISSTPVYRVHLLLESPKLDMKLSTDKLLAELDRQSLLRIQSFDDRGLILAFLRNDAVMNNQSLAPFLKDFALSFGEYGPSLDTLELARFTQRIQLWNSLMTQIFKSPKKSRYENSSADFLRYLYIRFARKKRCYDLAKFFSSSTKSDIPQLRFEVAKTIYCHGHIKPAVEEMFSLINDIYLPSANINNRDSELLGKINLKLADWSRELSETPTQISIFNQMRQYVCQNPADYECDVPSLFLERAVKTAPGYGRAWFKFATHAYNSGWQMFEKTSDIASKNTRENIAHIFFSDGRRMRNLTLDEIRDSVNELLSKYAHSPDSTSCMSALLQQSFPWASEYSLESARHILFDIEKEALQHFKLATSSYFKALHLIEVVKMTSEEVSQKLLTEKSTSSEADSITIVLRLFRLLMKYGDALEAHFMAGFAKEVRSWEAIIPQLFARLDHPIPFVRQQLCKLLGDIAHRSPKLLIYDTIVGLESSNTNMITKESLAAIYQLLKDADGILISETHRMIEETRKFTTLWEEEWLNTIATLQLDAVKRLQRVGKEFNRLNINPNLTENQRQKFMRESYDAIMKPVITTICQLQTSLNANRQLTEHESWFLETFGTLIEKACAELRFPTNISFYRRGWESFQKLHRCLAKEVHKVRSLKFRSVSPYLSSISGSQVPMPGLYSDETVTVQSFSIEVTVLPSKTKPKRLILYGSDGREYPFLFKGLEDLHLDQRIMQFLRITNELLKRDKKAAMRSLSARHYAVIPLSDHTGMLQWVDNALPMFHIYKQWQQRDHAANLLQGNNVKTESPRRPTELFFEKVSAALQREGMPVTTPRRNWPHHLIRTVYEELMEETPSDILEREFWISSRNPSEWRLKSESFSRSIAVMSIIGYIIGLGDRHMDNILIDFDNGEVVHIDYNICFEKGRKLRVPELVPFRLTRNLETALGVTGIEGNFRSACEHVLRTMRNNQEVLVTLLEAFVYDPLVDWSRNVDQVRESQLTELQVNIDLLSSRIAEMKNPLQEKYSKILDTAKLANECMEKLVLGTDYGDQISTNGNDIKTFIGNRIDDFATWRARNCQLFEILEGSLIETTFSELFLAGNQVQSPFFAQPSTLTNLDKHYQSQGEVYDQKLANWLSERDIVLKSIFEHLRFYKTICLPIRDHLLEDDPALIWRASAETFLKTSDSETLQNISTLAVSKELDANILAWMNQGIQFAISEANEHFSGITEILQLLAPSYSTQPKEDFLNNLQHQYNLENGPPLIHSCIISSLRLISLKTLKYTSLPLHLSSSSSIPDDDRLPSIIEKAFGSSSIRPLEFSGFFSIITQLSELLRIALYASSGRIRVTHLLEITNELTTFMQILFSLEYKINNGVLLHIFDWLRINPRGTSDIIEELYHIFEIINLPHDIHGLTTTHSYAKVHENFQAFINRRKNSGEIHLILLFEDLFGSVETAIRKLQDIATLMSQAGIWTFVLSENTLPTLHLYKYLYIRAVCWSCLEFYTNQIIKNGNEKYISNLGVTTQYRMKNNTAAETLREFLTWNAQKTLSPFLTNILSTIQISFAQLLPGRRDTIDIDNIISTMVEEKIISYSSFISLSTDLETYMNFSSMRTILNIVNMRKGQVETEFQQKQFELLRLQWISLSHSRDSHVRQQFLANLSTDLQRLLTLQVNLRSLAEGLQPFENSSFDQSRIAQTGLSSSMAALSTEQFYDTINSQRTKLMFNFEKINFLTEICELILNFENLRSPRERTQILGENLARLLESSRDSEPADQSNIEAQPNMDTITIVDTLTDLRENCDDMRALVTDITSLLEPISTIETDVDFDEELRVAKEKSEGIFSEWSNFEAACDGLDKILGQYDTTTVSETDSVDSNQILRGSNELSKEAPHVVSDLTESLKQFFEMLKAFEGSFISPISPDQLTPIKQSFEERYQSSHELGYEKPSAMTLSISINNRHESDGMSQLSYSGVISDADADAPNRKKNQGKIEQRNEYAVSVLRRVREKLEGIDFENKIQAVSEQVSNAINEAMSIDNLCAMYEGWTPWI